MKTKKQQELVDSFVVGKADEPLFRDIVEYLSELGYNPSKERSNIVFKHDLHNKQIAKIGIRKDGNLFLALRFSACRNLSERFNDIVAAYAAKYPTRTARCPSGDCPFCSGEAATHVYTYTKEDGTVGMHCGAYVIEITNFCENDAAEVMEIIRQEHDYLMLHEAGQLI